MTVVLLALTITSVLLAAAFAVDLGWWYIRAQEAQRTADAAALAGVVWLPNDFPKAISVARDSARANGFVDGVNDVSVQVSLGANSRQLVVRVVDRNVDRFFSSVASSDSVSIGRRAVAQYELPVPLGGPQNQFGGNQPAGVYLAVNGFCTRRADGDHISSGYYHANPGATFACQTPYSTASPTPPLAKNPDYNRSGYTYVVNIPPGQTSGCAVASPPAACTRTSAPVTIQVQDPRLNTSTTSTMGDQYTFPNNVGCSTRPGTTYFSVYGADTSPLDDSNNPLLAPEGVGYGLEPAPSMAWENLYTVPSGALAGRYLVRVRSAADQSCSSWSNAFGIRAAVNFPSTPFNACSTLPGSPLPSGYPFCPQVHGLDSMGLRVALTNANANCVGTKLPGNICTAFFLAQVDPVYAGKQMVITLFDPGEGAQRLRVLAPKVGSPNGAPVGFSWTTIDSGTSYNGTAAAMTGLDVSASSPSSTFNDRKLQLSVTLPSAADLAANGGWFRVEYEVVSTGSSLTDRTTWGVTVRGAPVRLVS